MARTRALTNAGITLQRTLMETEGRLPADVRGNHDADVPCDTLGAVNVNRVADRALVARLQAVLQGVPLRLAVLFGSAAAGLMTRDSDVDIAILPLEPVFDAVAERALDRELALAARMNVDLIDIERASTLLKWRIATTGVPLLEVSPGEFARFQARAASEYIDYAPALAYHGEIFRRRLIEQERASRTSAASEPPERSGDRGAPASEGVGGAGGAKPPGEKMS